MSIDQMKQAAAEGKLMGIGLAAYVEICGFGPWEHATVRVEPSGKISAYTGTSPHGQGMPLRAISTATDTTDDVTVMTSGHVGDKGPIAKAAPMARRSGSMSTYPHSRPIATSFTNALPNVALTATK